MEQNKRFAFLVSNGTDISMVPGFGSNVAEAKQYCASNLHRTWYVVEDKTIIENFINENKGIEFPNVKSELLLKDLAQFESDLKSLESQLINVKEENKMNIEKIKEFIAMRKDLKDAGVIGLDIYSDEVHVKKDELVKLPNLKVKTGYLEEYPYFIYTVVDDIKLHAILTEEEFQKYPQLQGYMVEDVQLDGGSGDDHAA